MKRLSACYCSFFPVRTEKTPRCTMFLIGVLTVTAALFVTSCNLFQKTPQNASEAETKKDTAIVVTLEEPDEKPIDDLDTGVVQGKLAPDIQLPDPDGNIRKLSDLKGNLILLDFWAAWCGPCRKANPELVQIYEKYGNAEFKNAEGFEIFSVSLDRKKEAWTKAIEDDRLTWEYHVSDLKFWDSKAARKYDVRSIPFNLLIDHRGVIVGKNLHGIALHKTIDQYVSKL